MKISVLLCMLLISLPTLAGTLWDDFSDGNFDGWTSIDFVEGQGQLSIEGSRLKIKRASIWSGGLVIGEEDWEDYSVECDAILHEKLANWSLIAVGLRLKGNAQQWRQVWMNYGFRPEGIFAGLVVYNHPDWLQDIKKAMPFEIGRKYHLKGVASGDSYEFYVDEELVLETQDDRFPSGKAGVYVNGAVASIDNVIIRGDDIENMNLSVNPMGKLTITWGQIRRSK